MERNTMINNMLVGAGIAKSGFILAAIWLKFRGRDISELTKPSGSPIFLACLLIAYVVWKLLFEV